MIPLKEYLLSKHEIAEGGDLSLGDLQQLADERKQKDKKNRAEYKEKKSVNKYLNGKQQEEFMVLAATAGKLEEMIEEWMEHGVSKERIKEARTALSFVYRTMNTYVKHISEKEIQKVIRRLSLSKIQVVSYGIVQRP